MRARDRLTLWLGLAVLCAAPLAIGGALRLTACALSAGALFAALPQLRSSRSFEQVPPLLFFLALAAGLTALQLIPLPAAVVALLSPATHQTVSDNAATLGREAPGFLALSLDPASTLVELAKLVGYLAFAVLCLRLARDPTARRRLLQGVACAGAGLALIGIAHSALGAEQLFGFYTPERAAPYLAPLLNPNHFAGLLGLSACVALGLAIATRGGEQLAWFGCFGLCVATNLLLQSRGGALALLAGALATVALVVARRRERAQTRGRTLADAVPTVVIALCGLILIATFTASGVAADLANTGTRDLDEDGGKFRAWQSAATLLREHRWTGIGRGAFEPAFTRVHAPSHRKIYSHLENEYLQAAIDWGLIGALALAGALIWIIVTAARRARGSPAAAGAAGGLFAVGVQNVADFSLQLPGVVMPVIAAAATLTHVGLTRGSRRRAIGKRVAIRASALALGALVVALAASPLASTVREDRARLSRQLDRDQPAAAAMVAAGREAMLRHPADYYAPAAVARVLFHLRDPAAVTFANRALRLHPTQPGLHRLVARMLLAAGKPRQACLQYALAVRHSGDLAPLIDEIVARFPAAGTAAECFPTAREVAAEVLDVMIRAERGAVALLVARRVDREFPDQPELLERVGRLELAAGNLQASETKLRRAHELAPTSAGAIALAQLLIATERPDEAERVATEAVAELLDNRDKIHVLAALAEGYSGAGRHLDARRALTAALEFALGHRTMQANIHRRLARVERALGNTHRAEWEEARARSLSAP